MNKIQTSHDEMKAQAMAQGKRFISLERELEERFQSDPPTDAELRTMLAAIEKARSELRFIHLATHLKTPHILTERQIQIYNKLRGYASTDPCDNVPKGHDAAMWRKHNGCS